MNPVRTCDGLAVVLALVVSTVLLGGAVVAHGRGASPAQDRVPPSSAPPSRATDTPRGPDGRPDFSGLWQALNSANWDLQAHAARQGPVLALGGAFSVPPGPGVVDGDEIPYLPAAAAKKSENARNWLARDPEVKCFLPGVPRMMYMPYPVQIVQGPRSILMASEFAGASRTVLMNSAQKSPVDSWMGWSVGHWDGDVLVVEVTDFNAETWFDRAGNYHSDALKVVERFSLEDRNTIRYEATITDPNVFRRPWTITMPLYRHREANARLMEYKCAEFVEELMFGHLRPTPPER